MKRFISAVFFLAFYMAEILRANARIAHDILTPRDYQRPRVVDVPLGPLSRRQVLALICLVTMTPGTICLDLTSDGRLLTVHSLYAESDEEVIRSVKDDYERRIRDVF
jgi:multicomponent Na+:H+ antiporter subunit E